MEKTALIFRRKENHHTIVLVGGGDIFVWKTIADI